MYIYSYLFFFRRLRNIGGRGGRWKKKRSFESNSQYDYAVYELTSMRTSVHFSLSNYLTLSRSIPLSFFFFCLSLSLSVCHNECNFRIWFLNARTTLERENYYHPVTYWKTAYGRVSQQTAILSEQCYDRDCVRTSTLARITVHFTDEFPRAP